METAPLIQDAPSFKADARRTVGFVSDDDDVKEEAPDNVDARPAEREPEPEWVKKDQDQEGTERR